MSQEELPEQYNNNEIELNELRSEHSSNGESDPIGEIIGERLAPLTIEYHDNKQTLESTQPDTEEYRYAQENLSHTIRQIKGIIEFYGNTPGTHNRLIYALRQSHIELKDIGIEE